jgi:hypothetical protein
MERIFKSISLIAALMVVALPLFSADSGPEDFTFFESTIRPLLADNCYKCHSADAEKIKGGFLLDSKPAMLRGGDSGPAIIPGEAEGSRLIQMIRQHPDFESMPPKTKLAQNQIEDIEKWIDLGAPDPRIEETKTDISHSDFDLEARRQWWSLQPVQKYQPPKVQDNTWPANEIDRFILAKLEEKEWSPAEPADRATLLRRLSFDLIGLAPTREELETFLRNPSPKAYQNQVDRLLASPHFGEKWARHWMDLVRYGESKSFEQDYTMPYTWRYRDYLIQAFNEDVPYDQFILESLAGDLLEKPRRDPLTADNESAKGPGFIYLTDGQHGPPDLHEDEARIFNGMIDTVTKTFLGSTVACARCHDHKFDAITTADYYSLYGILRSSRFTHHNTVSESLQKKVGRKLKSKHRSLRSPIFEAAKPDVENSLAYLTAANTLAENYQLREQLASLNTEYPEDKREKNTKEFEKALHELLITYCEEAVKDSLHPGILENWVKLKLVTDVQERWPELVGIHGYAAIQEAEEETSKSFQSVTQSLNNWTYQGLGFEDQPSKPGAVIVTGDGDQSVQAIIGDTLIGGQYTGKVAGAIRSPDFIIDGKPIELEAKGQHGAVRLVIRNYELTGRGPTTAKLYHAVNGDHWQKVRMETYLWEGQPAYLEIFQYGEATHSIKPTEDETEPNDNAYITVRFDGGPKWTELWKNEPDVHATLQTLWEKGNRNRLNASEAELLSAFFGAGLISADMSRSKKLNATLTGYRKLAQQIPSPRLARSLIDGDPKDQPVYIRGLHKNPSSEYNPRRWLDGLGGPKLRTKGSGRLEWAQYVANPSNPLTSRVTVNRLWKHIFEKGLVETVNDFGKMGKAPTHPELLDYLATDFVLNDWSIKSLIRNLVLSNTYQMDSGPSRASLDEDPDNTLLQHMPVKRLEAEAIRDHILACSGELNTTLFGPSVQAYVGDLPTSRAAPNEGPLDGDGRRSVYLEMRRSFLPSFLRAFDLPNATEPTGARPVTNVPAQSLALMNAPFVHEQAAAWAKRLVNSDLSTEERINQIHLTAYSRPASEKELAWAQDFIENMAEEYNVSADDPKVWTDLCHLTYNRKEFIYSF